MQLQKINRAYVPYISLAGMLLVLGGLGYLGFLAFVRNILMPGEFAAYGLVITVVAAGTASFFSPCSFTVLPSYIAFASSGQNVAPDKRFRNALKNGAVASLGVITVVAVLGAVIGILGTGIGTELSITGSDPSPLAKALRIGIGAFVLSMGLVHITGQTHRIPLLGRISALAIRAEGAGPGVALRIVRGVRGVPNDRTAGGGIGEDQALGCVALAFGPEAVTGRQLLETVRHHRARDERAGLARDPRATRVQHARLEGTDLVDVLPFRRRRRVDEALGVRG